MINWIRDLITCGFHYPTFRVWRSLDAEQRAILTAPFDPDDFVEVEHP